MPLKNYTSEVPAARSLAQIQAALVEHGARAFMVDYGEDKQPSAIAFTILTRHGELPFRLPANISAVEKLLAGMRKHPPNKYRYDYEAVMARIRAQASRTGWRIIRDWVEAQVAIIETEMVTLEEVFLPYMQLSSGRTLYQQLDGNGFRQIEGPKS